MNKKVNTLLFVLGATVFNIIVAIVSFILLSILFARLIVPYISENYYNWGFSIIFLASLAVSFMVYRVVLKYLLTKIDIEKYFDPIFVRKHNRPSNR